MSCAYSRESLALYIEGDLSSSEAEEVRGHLLQCSDCRAFCQELDRSQFLLRSLRRDLADPAAAAEVRRDVLSQIDRAGDVLGWAVRLERFFLLGMRRRGYALAVLGILAAVSVSLLGQQMRQRDPAFHTLARPDYRDWVLVSGAEASTPDIHNAAASSHRVYIEPTAYRAFAETGRFPEGTVMILELSGSGEKRQPVAVEASVKDSRFDGGWGYFGFTDSSGKLPSKVQAETNGCRGCHEVHGGTDHVFTQFRPWSRSSI